MTYKNINPSIWGPPLWIFMHNLTLAYPENPTEDDMDNLYNFFNTIQTVLPCEKCRINFKYHLERTPLSDEILADRVSVIKWLFNIHNEVNISTNKPVMSYDDFITQYTINSKEKNISKNITTNITTTIENFNNTYDEKDTKIYKKINLNEDNIDIFEYIKNNKVILGIIILAILLLLIYLNKKF